MTKVKSTTRCSTESNVFIRSMLGYSAPFYGNTFFNTYISIEPELMYLVFRKPANDKEQLFQDMKFGILKTNHDYCSSDETEDYIILTFYIPIKYIDDFYKIIDGKYSRTSEDYKQLLLMLDVPYSEHRTTLFKILYPQQQDVKALAEYLNVELPSDAELKSIMNLEKEMFKYEHLTGNSG